MSSSSTSQEVHSGSPGEEKATDIGAEPADFERGFRFWVVIIGLAISTLLASLEHTVVTTAAPYILEDLDLKEISFGSPMLFLFADSSFLFSHVDLPATSILCMVEYV